jgi:hypothetical protein
MLQHDYAQYIFLSFLYMPHKMYFFHKNLYTNIECHNVYQKVYVNFFNIFKIIFKLFCIMEAFASMSQNGHFPLFVSSANWS